MIKKLVRHGNSHALVIDKPVLDLLNIDEDTEIEIITDGMLLIMRPLRDTDPVRAHSFEIAAEEAVEHYGSVFRKLSR
jgi:antitoxin component of MazEF toxin-antitoxin module